MPVLHRSKGTTLTGCNIIDGNLNVIDSSEYHHVDETLIFDDGIMQGKVRVLSYCSSPLSQKRYTTRMPVILQNAFKGLGKNTLRVSLIGAPMGGRYRERAPCGCGAQPA